VALCAGVIAGLALLRSRLGATREDLLAYLPSGDAVVLSIDVAALRRAGLLASLAGSTVPEEPEYKAFVLETGFDYQQDLDLVLVAFQKQNLYALVRGRFNWRKLNSYVAAQDGSCRNSFCRVAGSTPQRNISFFPLKPDVMALAVSPDGWAANNLQTRLKNGWQGAAPGQPVWMAVPASYLHDTENLPSGTRLFAKAMEGAERVMLSLGVEEGRLEALLDVTCRSADEASVLSFQLGGVTRLLRSMIARENKTPNPKDLSGVLAAGSFRQEGTRVYGRWPIQREFLESLAAGVL